MVKSLPISSNARRALVSSYVMKGLVHSQKDVVELLGAEGIQVTQATASRDLEEVGAVRAKNGSRGLTYILLDEVKESFGRSSKVSESLILDMTASGNLVVVKTPPGGAQLLASALDKAAASGDLANLIGTIAGDDTVLAISKSASGGKALSDALRKFVNGSGVKNSSSGSVKRKARR